MKSYKLIIGEILTSELAYTFIKALNNKDIFNFKNYKVDLSATQNFIKASVFWGLYERSELNTITTHINSQFPIIELGASLGLTSLAIQNKAKNQIIISVEANTKLIRNLEKTKKINQLNNWHILNYAIDYSGEDYIDFEVDFGNLGSKKSLIPNVNTIKVKTATLKAIHKKHLDEQNFVLIADVEGAEIEIILEDSDFLKEKCKQIIIELHHTTYKGIDYNKKIIADLIVQKTKMKMIYNDGKTWVFNK